MATRIITNIIFMVALGALQTAFLSAFSGMLGNVNLLLVVLIFILGFAGFDFAIWWSLGAAFLLEIFSFSFFGTYLISLSLTVALAGFLLNHFFTNRSLYSFLALTALATIIYELIINFFSFIFSSSDRYEALASLNFWRVFEQIGLNLLLAFLIYYFLHFLGNSFRPVFLNKH